MLHITPQQLRVFYEEGFSMRQMATLLGCSVTTIKRKLYTAGLYIRKRYSEITDGELRNVIADLQVKHPNSGSEVISKISIFSKISNFFTFVFR